MSGENQSPLTSGVSHERPIELPDEPEMQPGSAEPLPAGIDDSNSKQKKKKQGRSSYGDERHKLFFGNLSYETSQQDLYDFVDQATDRGVRAVRIRQDKGFGFVIFKSRKALETALKLHHVRFQGRRLNVYFPSKSHTREKMNTYLDAKRRRDYHKRRRDRVQEARDDFRQDS